MRWPLEQSENIFLDLPYARYDQDKIAASQQPTDFQNFPATIQKAVINFGGGPVTLLNVHGPVNHNGLEDDARRLHFSDLILQNLAHHSIVAGDFNVQRQTKTITQLETKLQNVFGAELTTSFNLSQKDLVKSLGFLRQWWI
jgi:endonuclease/exonuclease/phosphatase family metal-dependent hydrolase